MNLISKNINIDFIHYSKYTFWISLSIIVIGAILFFTNGLKKSIDFTGGTIVDITIENKNFNLTELREKLKEDIDQNIIAVTTKTDNLKNYVSLTMKFLDNENNLHSSLTKLYSTNYEINQIESIGPKIGDELTKNARNAIIMALLLIGLYITIRFDSFYALGSILALFHDLAITLTLLLIMQYEISISIIAALLTIVGYSLNDTIVIYDRIRENINLFPKDNKKKIANTSLNKTLNRTIITSLTTLIVVTVLFFIGGNVLKPFSLSLIIGIIVGTYSSLFVATPFMLILEKKYQLEDLEEK